MSHVGNWRRNPRKMALEEERARERDRTLEEITFFQHGAHLVDLLSLHPCATREKGWRAQATCHACGASRTLKLEPLLASPYAHAPWPRVMAALVCSSCRGRPGEIALFRTDGEMRPVLIGKVSLKPPELEDPPRPFAIRTFRPEELVFKRQVRR